MSTIAEYPRRTTPLQQQYYNQNNNVGPSTKPQTASSSTLLQQPSTKGLTVLNNSSSLVPSYKGIHVKQTPAYHPPEEVISSNPAAVLLSTSSSSIDGDKLHNVSMLKNAAIHRLAMLANIKRVNSSVYHVARKLSAMMILSLVKRSSMTAIAADNIKRQQQHNMRQHGERQQQQVTSGHRQGTIQPGQGSNDEAISIVRADHILDAYYEMTGAHLNLTGLILPRCNINSSNTNNAVVDNSNNQNNNVDESVRAFKPDIVKSVAYNEGCVHFPRSAILTIAKDAIRLVFDGKMPQCRLDAAAVDAIHVILEYFLTTILHMARRIALNSSRGLEVRGDDLRTAADVMYTASLRALARPSLKSFWEI